MLNVLTCHLDSQGAREIQQRCLARAVAGGPRFTAVRDPADDVQHLAAAALLEVTARAVDHTAR